MSTTVHGKPYLRPASGHVTVLGQRTISLDMRRKFVEKAFSRKKNSFASPTFRTIVIPKSPIDEI